MNNKPFAILSLILVIVIVGFLSVGGLVSAGEPPELVRTFVSGDVETLIQISGNDAIVTIIGGNDAGKISSIYVYYSNDEQRVPRNSENTCNEVVVNQPIVFKNMAAGLVGKNSINVEAVFDDSDKSTKIIGTIYCDFS